MNIRKKQTTENPETSPQTLSVESLRERLTEQRVMAESLETEQTAIEGRLADVLATRTLGGNVDIDELTALSDRRIANRTEREDAALVIAGLENSLALLEAQEGELARDLLRPAFVSLDLELRGLEDQYYRRLSELSDTLERMQDASRRHSELTAAWARTPGANTAEHHGCQPLRQLMTIPANVLKAKRRMLDLTLGQLAEAWQLEPERHRAFVESERTHTEAEIRRIRDAQAEERRRAEYQKQLRDNPRLSWS